MTDIPPAIKPGAATAKLDYDDASQAGVLHLRGDWRRKSHRPEPGSPVLPLAMGSLRFDCTDLIDWDSTLLIYLHDLRRDCNSRSLAVAWDTLPAGANRLLKLASESPAIPATTAPAWSWLSKLGNRSLEAWDGAINALAFVGELVLACLKLCFGRVRMRWSDLALEMVKAGPRALAIVSLVGFLIGLILAFIGAIPLKWFGAEIYIASLIGIGILRLMGAVMTGVVMAGRTGAAYAAELGSMQVNEEIDALKSMGIPPMEFLVLPRFLALTAMLPLLGLFGNLVGILGGMVVGVYYLDLTYTQFWQQLMETTRLSDLFVGLFTCWVFGMLIAICGCLRGIQCGRSSEAVGQATTSAVVSSIICMVIATAAITVVTVALKI
ncbi:MAG TPA: ABC transporter permease [Lentisphaeria bacterium]|nr:ABC transporter permease [Lentisphaeria bacterium]